VSVSGYDARFWEPRRIGDTAKGRWRVRWRVAGREQRTAVRRDHGRARPGHAARGGGAELV